MAFTLEEFKSNFEGGAKQYLFYIKPSIPSGIGTEEATYMVSTGMLPGRSFEEEIASWQGMDYKIAGKSTFETWDVTFRVDRQARIRHAFEQWMDLIHNPVTNIRSMPSEYMEDQIAQLLDETGTPILTYKLHDAWPSNLATVDLDYAGSEIATFTVTFTFQYYTFVDDATIAGG